MFVEIDNTKNDPKDLYHTIVEIMKLLKVLTLEEKWYIKNLEHFKLTLKKFDKKNLEELLKQITKR